MIKGTEFEHDYAVFNAEGLLSGLRCMCCDSAVAGLDEQPSQKFPGRTFSVLK